MEIKIRCNFKFVILSEHLIDFWMHLNYNWSIFKLIHFFLDEIDFDHLLGTISGPSGIYLSNLKRKKIWPRSDITLRESSNWDLLTLDRHFFNEEETWVYSRVELSDWSSVTETNISPLKVKPIASFRLIFFLIILQAVHHQVPVQSVYSLVSLTWILNI